MSMSEKVKQLNELHLNLVGKLFFSAVAAWLLGKATNVKLRGKKDEIEIIINAMMASKQFQEELARPGATVQSVVDKLGMKHVAAREFERIFNVPFPL
jgi:hypothetical protein